jgi:hypothetical protein
MAVFCALCAQPGINIPENWREYQNRWVCRYCFPDTAAFYFSKTLFMRGFMMDGNFQAEHMKMRNPENDVPLSDGAGFMVSKKLYELHLKSTVERRQVRSISYLCQTLFSCSDRGRRAMTTAQSIV